MKKERTTTHYGNRKNNLFIVSNFFCDFLDGENFVCRKQITKYTNIYKTKS